jgi:hypothetical protein
LFAFVSLGFHLQITIAAYLNNRLIEASLGRERQFGFLDLAEKTIENDIIVVLRDESRQTVVFLEKAHQFLRRTIIR